MADPKDQWADFEEVKPAAKPAADPWAGFEVRPGPSPVSRAGTYIDNLGRQFAQGGLMGGADELTSALSAASVMPSRAVMGPNYRGPEPGAVYDDELRRSRQRDSEFTKNNPLASGVAQIGGAVATLPVTLAPRAASFIGRTVAGALTGAGYGGAAGFGHGEGGLENRLINAGIGAGGGLVLGGAIPAASSGAGFIGRGLKESSFGRYVGQNIATGLEQDAALIERLATKRTMQPKSLSAAAPEGGQPLQVETPMMSVAEALRRRADMSRNAVQRGAQERLAGEFQRHALDPRTAADELERLGNGAMLANAGPSGTLDSYMRIMHDLPGQSKSIIRTAVREQGEGAPGRMGDVFPPAPALYDAQRAIAANRAQVGADVYDPIRAAGVNMSDDMRRLLETPAIREVYDWLVADAARHGRPLTEFDLAHKLKRQLNQNADAAFTSGKPVNKDMVGATADEWERAFYAANRNVQAADQSFARAAGLEDTLERGTRWMRQGTGPDAVDVSSAALAHTVPQLDDAGVSVLRAGATNAARVPIGEGPAGARRLAGRLAPDGNELQARLVQIYGPDRARAIIQASQNERLMMNQAQTMVGGSQTSGNLAGLFDEVSSLQPVAQAVGAPGIMARIADWGLSQINKQVQGNEGVRNAIARIGTERNPTANLQNLEVIEALMRQRMNAQIRGARISGGTSGVGGSETGGYLAP